jgi:hydrogenase-4 component B
MRMPQYVLAALCALIGLFPQAPLRVLLGAISGLSGASATTLQLESGEILRNLSMLSWVSAGLFLSLLAVVLIVQLQRRVPKPQNLTWDCGYAAPTARMQYSASSIADDLVGMFRSLLRPQIHAPKIAGVYPRPSRFESHVPEVVLEMLVLPALRGIVQVAQLFRVIQRGTVHLYLFYVLLTLIVMLAVWR